jgi:hypothetical protein
MSEVEHLDAVVKGVARELVDYRGDFDSYVADPAQALDVTALYAFSLREINYNRAIHNLAFIQRSAGYQGDQQVGAITLASMVGTSRDVFMPHVVVRLNERLAGRLNTVDGRIPPYTYPGQGHRQTTRNFALVTDSLDLKEVSAVQNLIASFGGNLSAAVALTSPKGLSGENGVAVEERGTRLYSCFEVSEEAEDLSISPSPDLSGWLESLNALSLARR